MTNRIEGLAKIDKNTSDIGVGLQKPRNITEKMNKSIVSAASWTESELVVLEVRGW